MSSEIELIKYKEKLSDQKKMLDIYTEKMKKNNENYSSDYLGLIKILFFEAIYLLDNVNLNVILKNPYYDDLSIIFKIINTLENQVFNLLEESVLGENKDVVFSIHHNISNLVKNLNDISGDSIVSNDLLKFKEEKEKINKDVNELKNVYEGWKNRDIYEIFKTDSDSFKKLAQKYEIAFYFVIFFVTLYFLGLTLYVPRFDLEILSIAFPEKIHGNISAEFYIQKISFLVLSTTLAAFLLKRSFMNRRLADEAYRTAKELDALPRYMEGMPDEMKEKIRFDLAYKYFGNGIHHDSYTGGENLMHENIKANTEFVKVLKGMPSTTGESKADKDKNE